VDDPIFLGCNLPVELFPGGTRANGTSCCPAELLLLGGVSGLAAVAASAVRAHLWLSVRILSGQPGIFSGAGQVSSWRKGGRLQVKGQTKTMNCLANPTFSAAVKRPLGCPLCSGLEQRNLAEYKGGFLRRCLNCGGSYVFPQPSATELLAHFQEDHTNGKDLERKFEINREKVLSRVADHIQRRRQGGAILDVGCATGLFLARFFSNPNWNAWGLELAPATAEKAAAKGIRVYRGDIYKAQFSDNSFDVITVLDAFYYFPEPERELAEFHRILARDGLLVLELPLATSRIWRTSMSLGRLLGGSRRPLLQTSDHLFYFTPKSVALLLERCGFRVQTILPLPGNRQPHLLRDLAYRAYALGSSLVYSVSGARIFLGPRFLVAAAKTP
jgi:SAM-dependent methyltransferase